MRPRHESCTLCCISSAIDAASQPFMTRTVSLLCALAAALIGCGTALPISLVLSDRSTGARYVGAVVSSGVALATASIEINGVFYSGKFDPSNDNFVALLVGTGGDLLHCVFHFDLRTRIGVGECLGAGARRFDVTLSD